MLVHRRIEKADQTDMRNGLDWSSRLTDETSIHQALEPCQNRQSAIGMALTTRQVVAVLCSAAEEVGALRVETGSLAASAAAANMTSRIQIVVVMAR